MIRIAMNDQEGVIKYELLFTSAAAVLNHDYADLGRWHRCFKNAGILGQDPGRYEGLGFGNLSQRLNDSNFLISGTQTGYLDLLTAADYALVTQAVIAENRISAEGQIKPSSEALTHAAVYALDAGIRYVFHVHSPDIWKRREQLALPETAAEIPYGTPEMANEMVRLYRNGAFEQMNVFAMAGHEDGIVAFDTTADKAGTAIMQLLELR